MVSLRRRKLLGFCTGVADTVLATLPTMNINENATIDSSNSIQPTPLYDLNIRAEEENDISGEITPTKPCGFNHSYDQNNQPNTFGLTSSKELDSQPTTEWIPFVEVKQRKQHQRRRSNDQEHGSMRGVYFKNLKWQAAIKVDKKQIHLGTVSSRKEAARLYDRAAFMCGREPNFKLSEEEKQELRKLKWDEFLAMTRSAITCKRSRRGRVIGKLQRSFHNTDWEGEQGADSSSVSDDANLDTCT